MKKNSRYINIFNHYFSTKFYCQLPYLFNFTFKFNLIYRKINKIEIILRLDLIG